MAALTEDEIYLLSLLPAPPEPEPIDPIEEAANSGPDEWSMYNLHFLIVFMPAVPREIWARVMVYCCGPRFRFTRGQDAFVRSLNERWWNPYNHVTIYFNWWVESEYPRWARHEYWPTRPRPTWRLLM